MTRAALYRTIEQHGELVRARFIGDPFGLLMVAIGLILLGYGEVNLMYTPLRIELLEPWTGAVFGGIEVLSILLALLAVARRTVTGDFYVTPTPISAPMIAVGVILALIPWMRMVATEGGLRLPFEANFIPFMVLLFFAWRWMLHPSDVRLVAWMILAATLYKCFEGILIFTVNDVVWGALTGWRDGMLLSLGVSGALIAYVIKPDGEEWYRRFRKFLLVVAPVIIFVFVLAMRRSYFLSVAASLPFLWYQLRGGERKTLLVALVIASPLLLGAAATFGLDAISTRLGNIAAPSEEGSTAWRLIEYYNVTQMILERPFFGWPLGIKFINVTGIELPESNSLMPHNSYLYALLRGGIVGLLAWLWFLKRGVSMTLGAIRSAPTAGYRFLGTWMYVMVLFTIFSGFTSPVLGSRLTILIPLCMVLAGLLPGADYRRSSKPATR